MQNVLLYQWLEESLRLGEKVSEDSYILKLDSGGDTPNTNHTSGEEPSHPKKIKMSSNDSANASPENGEKMSSSDVSQALNTASGSYDLSINSPIISDAQNKTVSLSGSFI